MTLQDRSLNQFVKSEDDIVGQIAYSIYVSRRNNANLNETELAVFEKSVNVDDLRRRAEEKIEESFQHFANEYLDQQIEALQEDMVFQNIVKIQSVLEQGFESNNKEIQRFKWPQSIAAGTVSSLVVPLILVLLLLLFEGQARELLEILSR